MVVEEAVRRLGWELAGTACVVQGYGKVGGVAAHELADRGARVLAVSDLGGGIHDPAGLDLAEVDAWRREHGDFSGFGEADHVSNAELLLLPCDVLVLAATENQVTGANAGDLAARLVAEGANGPTTLEADAILADKGVPVLPDILTNAGGVAVSYFEWVQDIQRLFWSREEIRSRLGDLMHSGVERVWSLAEAEGYAASPGRARPLDPRGGRGAGGPRDLPVIVRDALLHPRVLEPGAPAQEAAALLAKPSVESVLVVEGERLVGCVTGPVIVASGRRGT